MSGRTFGIASALALALGAGALTSLVLTTPAAADPSDFVAGSSIELTCNTNAIGMDFNPFKVTDGSLTLSLQLTSVDRSGAPVGGEPKPAKVSPDGQSGGKPVGAAKPKTDNSLKKPATVGEQVGEVQLGGSWNASVEEGQHGASLGVVVAKLCRAGCEVRQTPEGNLELWAPRPIIPSKLAKDETLTVVSLDTKTLEMKATTFRGNQLSILEKGKCEKSKPGSSETPASELSDKPTQDSNEATSPGLSDKTTPDPSENKP